MTGKRLTKILLVVVPFIITFQHGLDRMTYEDRLELNDVFKSIPQIALMTVVLFTDRKILGFSSHYSNKFGPRYVIVDFLSFHFTMVSTSIILSFITEAYCFYAYMGTTVLLLCQILEKLE
jgi:hypothetical protein